MSVCRTFQLFDTRAGQAGQRPAEWHGWHGRFHTFSCSLKNEEENGNARAARAAPRGERKTRT